MGSQPRKPSSASTWCRGSGSSGWITSEDVQRLKSQLRHRAVKTLNYVLTVLNTLLKKALEWEVIDRLPGTIRLLPVPKQTAHFHDFEEFERLVEAANVTDAQAHLIVLLGGESGSRCGEIMTLEWRDIDLGKRQLCIQPFRERATSRRRRVGGCGTSR